MRRPESHAGTWGWLGLAVYVGVFDFTAPESLTHAAERARASRIGQLLVPATIAYVGAHIMNVLPHEYDLFYKLIELHGEKPVETTEIV